MQRAYRNILRLPLQVAVACLFAIAALALSASTGAATSTAFADEPASNAAADAQEENSKANASAESKSASSASAKKDEDSTPEVENLVDPTQRADNSFIYDTTIDSLFNESSLNDGRVVQVVGEVIGDKIASDKAGYCWITLTSTDEENPATISVLLTDEQASQIDHFGRYGVTGTTFQVRGTFHQSCTEHEGLPDIHATDSATIKRGIEHHDKLRLRRFIPGAVMVFVGLLLMGAYYFVRERTR